MCYSLRRAGISNHIFHLVNEISKQNAEFDVLLFIPSRAKNDFKHLGNIKVIPLPCCGIITRIFWEQIILPPLFFILRLSILHSLGNVAPVLLGKKNVTTIHDVYFLRDTTRFGFAKQLYLTVFVQLSVKLSKFVICVSNYTKSEILHFYSSQEEKIRVIYQGFHKSIPLEQGYEWLKQKHITKPFFLFVGTLEPGKNISSLITAFEKFSLTHQLVLVGKKGWRTELLEPPNISKQLRESLIWTGYLKDEEVATLYSKTVALVLPSTYEGFGLPVLEAMYHGCPVCCSNSSSLPEIASDAAIYFNPLVPEEIAKSMEKIKDTKLRKEIILLGYKNIEKFSWSKCTVQTLALYHQV